MTVNRNTRIPFGNTHKGRKLKDCPDNYLKWIAVNLIDTGFHEFAIVARDVLQSSRNSDEEADEFLKSHGVDPNKL